MFKKKKRAVYILRQRSNFPKYSARPVEEMPWQPIEGTHGFTSGVLLYLGRLFFSPCCSFPLFPFVYFFPLLHFEFLLCLLPLGMIAIVARQFI